MAIGTGDGIHKFGTQDTVSAGTTAGIVDGAFSATADIVQWTNTDDAPQADFVLNGATAAAPNANSVINLYARKMNIDGVSDANVPSLTNFSIYLGRFKMDSSGTGQIVAEEVDLPNGYSQQVYEFYIENKSGQTFNANWILKITPRAIGPAA